MPDRKPARIACAILALAVALVFGRSVTHEFLNFDDDAYVVINPHVHSGLTADNLVWAFTSVSYFYWQPITWVSHMIDVSLFGVRAGPHHAMNVALHAVNACLLLLVLFRLTGELKQSAAAASLFALHPLRVESVAWVAERKDLLGGLFVLLTVAAYAGYVARPDRRRFAWVLAAFACALMSKPTAVTTPLLLLLLDRWPLQRKAPWTSLVREKAVLAAMAAAAAALTWWGQHEMGAVDVLGKLPVGVRVMNAFAAPAAYLRQTFWPQSLAIIYPYDPPRPGPEFLAAVLLLVALSAAAIWLRRKTPQLFTGWFWFLIALIPVAGFVQAGAQGRADRFTYIPHMGLAVAFVWTLRALVGSRGAVALSGVAAAIVGIAAFQYTGLWKSSETIFAHAVAVTRNNWMAHAKLGLALRDRGDTRGALEHLSRAVSINPRDAHTHYQIGLLHDAESRPGEAAAAFRKASTAKPDYAEAWYAEALMLGREGRHRESLELLRRTVALALPPVHASDAHNRIGAILAESGRVTEAIPHFRAAVRLNPTSANARRNLMQAEAAIGGR